MNYQETGELVGQNMRNLGVSKIIERFSQLANSIADHIHWKVAKHWGLETCDRMTSIMQGHSLSKEISLNCILCKKEVPRGRVIASPDWDVRFAN